MFGEDEPHFDGRIFFKWVETTKIFSSGFFPPKEWSLLLSYKEVKQVQPNQLIDSCFVLSKVVFLRGRDKINPPNLGGTSKPEDVAEAPSGSSRDWIRRIHALEVQDPPLKQKKSNHKNTSIFRCYPLKLT